MTDPDLKYCPECNDEYRADIEKCGVCCIDLITGHQKIEMEEERQRKLNSRTSELSPDDDLVALRGGPLPEMRHFAALLDAENIGTALLGIMSSCGKDRFGNTLPVPTSYNLMVKREDAMDAHHIIEEEHKKATALAQHESVNDEAIFNPHASEAQCPACGHTFPTTEKNCPDCGLSFG
jgi:hypothetical protein